MVQNRIAESQDVLRWLVQQALALLLARGVQRDAEADNGTTGCRLRAPMYDMRVVIEGPVASPLAISILRFRA